MIQLSKFKKHFGSKLILDISEFEFKEGVHWVKGQNGSGKTTFLRCLAGILPFTGSISLDGIELNQTSLDYRSKINYAEAEPQYPGFLTGIEMIEFFRKINKTNSLDTDYLAEYFGMNEYKNDKIFSYSSGMKKKLSLVLVFIGPAKWVLLDEPLITLDQEAQSSFVKLISDKRSEGVSFLISTHQDWPKGLAYDYIHNISQHTIISEGP